MEKKSVKLASEVLEMTGEFDKPGEKAKKILESRKALEKFKKIIKAQNGDPEITSEDLEPAKNRKVLKADKKGTIKHVDNIYVAEAARRLGCPGLEKNGIFLHHNKGDEVKEGDALLTLYAKNEEDIEEASEYLDEHSPMKIKA